MMPSRGIRLVKNDNLVRFATRQNRQLSYATQPRQLSGYTPLASIRRCNPASNQIFTPIAARFASTSSSSASPITPDLFPNLDTINLDIDTAVTTSEHIGFLSELGIKTGWGPSSVLQWVLEHIHVDTGLPWWASIILTGLAVRAITFPLYLRSTDNLARQNAMTSITQPIMARINAAREEKDQMAMMAAVKQLQTVRKAAGLSVVTQMTPMVVQGVIGYCGFKLMNKMVNIPVPGLLDGGFGWLTDLTLSDGFLILPVLMAGTVHMLVRLGGESGSTSQQMPPGMQNIMLYGMPGIMFAVLSFQPAAVCMWFIGSGSVGVLQALAFRNESFRKFFKLAPMYVPEKTDMSSNPLFAMFGNQNSSTSSSASSSSSSPRPTGPVYQAPNLGRRAGVSGRTIDTHLVGKAESSSFEGVQVGKHPAASDSSKPGILSRVSSSFSNLKTRATEQNKQKMEQNAVKAVKKRAEAYEEKASAGTKRKSR